jgi:hypothetical protein
MMVMGRVANALGEIGVAGRSQPSMTQDPVEPKEPEVVGPSCSLDQGQYG